MHNKRNSFLMQLKKKSLKQLQLEEVLACVICTCCSHSILHMFLSGNPSSPPLVFLISRSKFVTLMSIFPVDNIYG